MYCFKWWHLISSEFPFGILPSCFHIPFDTNCCLYQKQILREQRVREDINALCTWCCHCCGPVSDVDSTQFWLMMKSLNYCPKCCWSSRVCLCSVRVTEASFGNKYGLCLLAGDLRLLLLSQVTSEVVCKGMEKVRFYNGKSKRSVLKMSDSPWRTCRKKDLIEYATTGEMLREYDATLLWNFRSAF